MENSLRLALEINQILWSIGSNVTYLKVLLHDVQQARLMCTQNRVQKTPDKVSDCLGETSSQGFTRKSWQSTDDRQSKIFPEAGPNPPTFPYVTFETANGMDLFWFPPEKPYDKVRGYIVSYYAVASSGPAMRIETLFQFVAIKGLQPETEYEISVVAYNEDKEGKRMESSATTFRGKTLPDANKATISVPTGNMSASYFFFSRTRNTRGAKQKQKLKWKNSFKK